MKAGPSLLQIAAAVLATTMPSVVFAQVASAALDFAHQLGTQNVIVTDQLSLTNSHIDSGVAAGGTVYLDNAVLNSNSSYTDDPYAFRSYGQLTMTGSDQSLNGGAKVVMNATTNNGLHDFPRNGGNQRVLTFGSSVDSTPQLTFNGNSGPPAPASFVATADNYFASRAAVLGAASATFAAATAAAPNRSGNRLTFATTTGALKVFNLDVSAQAGGVNEIMLQVAANSTAVINVFNAGAQWNPGSVNFLGSDLMGQSGRVLWNLEGGTGLVTANEWYGSILGVNSSIVANGNLNGQIFADDLTLNSRELHYAAFAPIPEPSTYALLLGVATLGLVIQRRAGRLIPAP